MSTYTTVTEYEAQILEELDLVEEAIRINILALLEYAKKKEKEKNEPENRDPRPKPLENAEYFRMIINLDDLPTETLKNLIEGLLQLVESIEQYLQQEQEQEQNA